MKKRISIFLVAALMGSLLLTSGCADSQKKEGNLLYAQGLEIVSLITEMSENEVYLNTLSGNEEIHDLLSHAGSADPTQPKAVYEISVQEDALMQILQFDDMPDISDSLKSTLRQKSYAAFAAHLNLLGGATVVAASSICTAGKSFLSSDFTGNTIYLYLYEDGAPVLIVFSSGPEDIVTASGSFLLLENFNPKNKEDVQSFLSFFMILPVEVTEISP